MYCHVQGKCEVRAKDEAIVPSVTAVLLFKRYKGERADSLLPEDFADQERNPISENLRSVAKVHYFLHP